MGVLLLERGDELLVLGRVVCARIVEDRRQTQRSIAELLQVVLVGLGRAEELHAGLGQAVLVVGLDEPEVRRAARQEGVGGLCATGLDALHEGAEVRGGDRHTDALDHGAALLGELALEGCLGVDAGPVVGDGGHDLLHVLLGRPLRRGNRDLPQRVAGANEVLGLLCDGRSRGVEDDRRRARLLDQRCHGHGIGREHEATEVVHLVLDQQLLNQGLGQGGVGAARVAIDELDVLPGQRAALACDIGLRRCLEQRAVVGERSREGPDDADLHVLRHGLGGGERQRSRSEERARKGATVEFHRVSPVVVRARNAAALDCFGGAILVVMPTSCNINYLVFTRSKTSLRAFTLLIRQRLAYIPP
ncbi:hypothetical protein D3C87_1287940 [compost metagenome]